jgi:hypothetical protein
MSALPPKQPRHQLSGLLDAAHKVRGLRVAAGFCLVGLLAGLFLLFYPFATRSVIQFSLGALSWCVALLFATWPAFLRFGLALLIAVATIVGFCSTGAWLEVRWIAEDKLGTPWRIPKNGTWSPRRDIVVVTMAVLAELLLPLFLILSLVALVSSVATLLLSDSWVLVQTATDDIAGIFREGLRADKPAMTKLMISVWGELGKIVAALKEPFAKSTAVLAGALSASVSLVIFLFKRRQANLNACRIISTEIVAISKQTLGTLRAILVPAFLDGLAGFPADQPRIMTSSDRELLLLDPGAGQAARLPACLLEAVVLFFHADLDLTQSYNAIGSIAFAKASEKRRRDYLEGFVGLWTEAYQPATFSALFRLALYSRLRAWSI